MHNIARKIRVDVAQELGRVVGAASPTFVVRASAGDFEARRAASCLIEPATGDRVVLAITSQGEAIILAVVDRDSSATAVLLMEGDVELRLPSGRFAVATKEGIDLVSAKDVCVAADGLRVTAARGSVLLRELSYLGDVVRAEAAKLKLIAGTFDATLERWSQKVKRSFRTVEELDQVRAARIDYTATSTMSLHAENALLTAEELVKVDGEQIHLG